MAGGVRVADATQNDASRIEQLDEMTIGRIAAGEVVERPAQVVKELLENSVDSEASRIEVIIQAGGFERIEVIDDGSGIVADDLVLAVRRHATSKLRTAEDLSAIGTLGFRGEALASIGSVSRLTIASRTARGEGASITVDAGIVGEVEPIGTSLGTRITVNGLFQNVPARLAFQRRPSTETAATVDVVSAHALAHPEVSFHLEVDGRRMISTPAVEDVSSRLFDILGAATNRLVSLVVPVSDEAAPGSERWSGWISPPDISRGRPDDVHIFVNGRAVAATPFLKSIRRGYHSRLMVGRHPVCVLFLTLPAKEVDVNIHPTKREVRLKHSWRVLERLERALQETLLNIPTGALSTSDFPLGRVELDARNIGKGSEDSEAGGVGIIAEVSEDSEAGEVRKIGTVSKAFESAEIHGVQKRVDGLQEVNPELDSEPPSWVSAASTATSEQQKPTIQSRFIQPQDNNSSLDGVPDLSRPMSKSEAPQFTLPGLSETPQSAALSSEERHLHRHSYGAASVSPLDEPNSDIITEVPKMEPLAQLSDSYILAQGEDCLYIIDQHALHERIRYERLKGAMTSWKKQELIDPIRLELSPQQAAVVGSEEGRLGELGFSIEIVDEYDSHQLMSVPELLIGDDRLHGFLTDLIAELANSSQESTLDSVEQLQDEIAFMRSCRGAVKANQRLSLAEMRRLIEDMQTIRNPWACVHGRPTVLELDGKRLDDHFGRLG
jgi:DNA mismatch repair protein MutL